MEAAEPQSPRQTLKPLSERNYLYCWTVFFCETTGNDLPHKCLAVGWVSSQQTQEESDHARLS